MNRCDCCKTSVHMLEVLTDREAEVLTLLAKGFTIKELSALFSITTYTVNDHIKAIYKKLDVSSRAEAGALAVKLGLPV